ncbi:MAG: hypothetical protein AAF547_04950 [Actinomycetota bacterium]
MTTSTTADPRTLEAVKAFAIGEWTSLSVELRPTEDRTGSGVVEPTRLRRRFTYHSEDNFTGVISMYADDYGHAHLMDFEFRGRLVWGEAHPIADGAFAIDYVLDAGFGVTPHHEQAAEMLNAGLVEGMTPFAVGEQNDILGRAFPMFDLAEGQVVTDYDLIYFHSGLLFMGAKHVDGTPFDQADRRPHQLQIPLRRIGG